MGVLRSVFGLIVLLMLSVLVSAEAAVDDFPGRNLYPEVPYIDLNDLHKQRNDVHIVDVRSAYEYSTLRITNAINIPLASKDFAAQMRSLRKKENKPIVVYCNGKTCMKSYKAARKCMVEKIPDVTAYDAGVMDWAKIFPKNTLLLGKSLDDPRKLITKATLKKHSLSPDAFSLRVAETSDIVLDVRDRFQREGLSIFVGRERRINLDDTKRLDRYINKAKRDGKGILIYDAAGKQVRWLQYYLEEKGVKKYYFMEGGISAYYKQMKAEF